jgi:glycosyltransferase involved in cell wall biosynthesis
LAEALREINVLYHLTTPPLTIPESDAVIQEVEVLRARFGGELVYLNPNRSHQPRLRLPRVFYGFHRLPYLRKMEAVADIHHLYNPELYPFPILRWLRRPIVYSVAAGLQAHKRPFNRGVLDSLHTIVVSNERDLAVLNSWGFDNCRLIRPGIDVSRFIYSPLPLRSDLTLMAGSAPWTREQFRLKGVDALLEAARDMPKLRLVFLWRGILAEEMRERVRRNGLEDRVEVLNEKVDVNQVLARVHAAVVLAATPAIIKAYPHSLLESLAAGKPVLVSRCIPMAGYVAETGCGQVVERVTAADLLQAIGRLIEQYGDFQANALRVGRRDFSQQALIAAYERLYGDLLVAAPLVREGRVR